MIKVEEDNCFSVDKNNYKILKSKKEMILKKIYIKKKQIEYFFIGGMCYSHKSLSLKNDISLPYPFSTYYTLKIIDKNYNGNICRSLIYVKLPLIIVQFKDECVSIKFDTTIKINDEYIYPFISLEEDNENYIITFYLFKSFVIKEKENAWLGYGKKKKIELNFTISDKFQFDVEIYKTKNWKNSVREIYNNIQYDKKIKSIPIEIFQDGKKALWRSYDNLTGSFLQLPWRETTNFALINSSYSLMSYEAVRLNYFLKWHIKFKDKQFLEWARKIKFHFIDPKLIISNPKIGSGYIWYNMTNLTRHGLKGYFYMDCGFAGYPGGQASIAYNLLESLDHLEDDELEFNVEKSLEYILSTQKQNGAWPMAIHQKGIIKFRPEKLNLFESHGGTAECIRALIRGYKKFKDSKMINAAIKALKYLESDKPICYNGLRDIGINEPEAFSSIIVIEAYLDAYELFKEKKYLDIALNYAYYSLSWFYLFNKKNDLINFNFHPISYSITPRISPYENFWIISTYMRLFNITKDNFWKKISIKTFNIGINWITSNGGISEGVFPKYNNELKLLPMEQTFATIELMNASSEFIDKYKEPVIDEIILKNEFDIKREKDIVNVYYKQEKILSFNISKIKIIYLKNSNLNKYGVSFSFFGPYLLKNIIIQKIIKYLRGDFGKIILGIPMIKYFIFGVNNYKKDKEIKLYLLENVKKPNFGIKINKDNFKGFFETKIHRIEYDIKFKIYDNKIRIIFYPLIIKLLTNDIKCSKVLFPIIGEKCLNQNKDELYFSGFILKCSNKDIVLENDFTAIDQTLSTNWTHGGIYNGNFEIIIKMK